MKETTLPTGLLDLNEKELLFLLGDQLQRDDSELLAFGPLDRGIEAAKAWMAKHRLALRERICGNALVAAITDEKSLSNQRVILLLTIADLVASLKLGVGPFIPAALIVKQGVTEFCKV